MHDGWETFSNTYYEGWRDSGILEAVAQRRPCFIEQTGLSPILSVQQALDVIVNQLKALRGRVMLLGNSRVEYVGQRMPFWATTEEKLNELRQKRTLRAERMDLEHKPLEDFCGLLSSTVGARVTANGYLGHNGSEGAGRHDDDHEVIIWQQEGCKLWQVWEPEIYPVKKRATVEPIMSPLLHPGSLLYIPTAYPHAAQTPTGGESFHLTFGFWRPGEEFVFATLPPF